MKITVRIASAPGGYRAWCPAMPGCAVRAPSPQQALDKLDEAIRGYLYSLDVLPPGRFHRVLVDEAVGSVA